MKTSSLPLRGALAALVLAICLAASVPAQARVESDADDILEDMWEYCIEPVLRGQHPHNRVTGRLMQLPRDSGGPLASKKDSVYVVPGRRLNALLYVHDSGRACKIASARINYDEFWREVPRWQKYTLHKAFRLTEDDMLPDKGRQQTFVAHGKFGNAALVLQAWEEKKEAGKFELRMTFVVKR